MQSGFTKIYIMLSSPGDVKEEIDDAREVIEEYNESIRREFVEIVPLHWSTDSYVASGKSGQDIINDEITKTADAVLAIFWNRFGTPTKEFGSGTEEELRIALNLGKQVLLLFSNRKNSNVTVDKEQKRKVDEFKKQIAGEKNLLYRDFSTRKEFKDQFRRALIGFVHLKINEINELGIVADLNVSSNVLPYEMEAKNNIDIKNNDIEFSGDVSLNKKLFAQVTDSYDYIFEYLLGRTSEFKDSQKLDSQIVSWLCTNQNMPSIDNVKKVLSSQPKLKHLTKIVELRLNAFKENNKQNYVGALVFENQAKMLAEEESVPDWLKHDILLDLRNTWNRANPLNFSNPYQVELEKDGNKYAFPFGNDFSANAFESLISEQIEEKTKSRSTVRFSNKMKESLSRVLDYSFISFLFGSIVHADIARFNLVEILYSFGELYDDNDIKFNAFKIALVVGNINLIKAFAEKNSDSFDVYYEKQADELWKAISGANAYNSDETKFLSFKYFGQYLEKYTLLEMQSVLPLYAKNIKFNTSEYTEYQKALVENFDIFTPEQQIILITKLIQENGFSHRPWQIINLLQKIELELSDADCSKIVEFLESKLDEIVAYGNSYFVLNEPFASDARFKHLKELISNKLDGQPKLLFEVYSQATDERFRKMMDNGLKIAKKQFDDNNGGETRHIYASDEIIQLYQTVMTYRSKIIPQKEDVEKIELLLEYIVANIKAQENLYSYLNFIGGIECWLNMYDMTLSEKIVLKFIQFDLEPEHFHAYEALSKTPNIKGVQLKQRILKESYYNKENDWSELFSGGLGSIEKIELSRSIRLYLLDCVAKKVHANQYLILFVVQLLSDKDEVVRANTVEAGLILYELGETKLANKLVEEMLKDTSSNKQYAAKFIPSYTSVDNAKFLDTMLAGLEHSKNRKIRNQATISRTKINDMKIL